MTDVDDQDDPHGGGQEHELIELVDGPLDGLREALATAAELAGPREDLGVLMVVDGWTDRALYEPDPPPAPATRWRYRGPAAL